MSKFQVGDKVVSVKDTPEVPEGFIGYIIDNELKVNVYDYAVRKEHSYVHIEYFNSDELELLLAVHSKQPDAVHSPKHYAVFDDIEAIEIIARSMTSEMFKGYCFGNLLKYRLRAGGKDELQQEINKANKYKELYEKYKELCQ